MFTIASDAAWESDQKAEGRRMRARRRRTGERRKRRRKEAKGRDGEGHTMRKRPIEGRASKKPVRNPHPPCQQNPALMILAHSPRPVSHSDPWSCELHSGR